MNDVSKELKEIIDKEWNSYKKNQKIIFQINGIRWNKDLKRHEVPRGYEIPDIDRIYDKWKGEYVDIAYEIRKRPTGPNAVKESHVEIGKLMFRNSSFGQIILQPDKNDHYNQFFYLFLSNYNTDNNGKPWYIQPSGVTRGFHRVNLEKDAGDKVQKRKRIREAEEYIDSLTTGQFEEIAKGMFHDYSVLTDEQITEKLYKVAEKEPDRIFTLGNDKNIKIMALIRDAIAKNYIEVSLSNRVIIWADTKETICNLRHGEEPEVTLRNFFISDEGSPLMHTLRALMNPEPEPSIQEVATKPEENKTATTTKKKTTSRKKTGRKKAVNNGSGTKD